MKYYKHNLIDYDSSTTGFSPTQHGIYLRLIHHCYLYEEGLPGDIKELRYLTNCSTKKDKESLEFVINKKFQKKPDGEIGYTKPRIERDLDTYKAKCLKNQRNAKSKSSQSLASGKPVASQSLASRSYNKNNNINNNINSEADTHPPSWVRKGLQHSQESTQHLKEKLKQKVGKGIKDA